MAGIGVGTKLVFGIGQMAEGFKNIAFTLFLFFYYTSVLGLSGGLVGTAIFIALVFDAVTDPLAGSLSDSFRHRWGRRHPFMYASAFPLALFFALVFNPPAGLGETGLFLWLTTFAVLTRGAMTLYHVPHLALGAELSSDYEERSVIVAYRNFFGSLGALCLIFVGYGVFFPRTAQFDYGQLNPAGYPAFGLFFALGMALTILVSAFGTHHRIPHLPRPPERPSRFGALRVGRELAEALENRSFRIFFVGLVAFFVARGIELVLAQHMGTYFWQLPSEEFRLVPLAGIVGLMVGTPFWALAARRLEKRPMMLVGILWFSVLTMAPPVLKIVGWFPSHGSSGYLPTLVGVAFVAALGGAAGLVAAGSMLADIADEHEIRTWRRQEGIFFGALSFSGKASAGLGGLIAGVGLDLIRFPTRVEPGSVPLETLNALALLYGPGVFLAGLVGALAFSGYGISRARHAEIRAELDRRRLRPDSEREVAEKIAAAS